MCMQEMATADNRPKDVDREYVLNFMIVNEAASFMLRQNIATYLPSVPQLQYSQLVGSYPSFADSNEFHTINGNFHPNNPNFCLRSLLVMTLVLDAVKLEVP